MARPGSDKARERDARVQQIVTWLGRRGSRRNREGMARYGIVSAPGTVFGVPLSAVRALAKRHGRDHALAAALWKTGYLECRLLAAFVDEPAKVTAAQMERWTRVFDNWAVCDGLCLHLFAKTPFAWAKVAEWRTRNEEFVKRAAFALLAVLAVHEKAAPDQRFREALPWCEEAAADPRNFVRKAVSWALRSIGKRSEALRVEALTVAQRLSNGGDRSTLWVGRDVARELESAAVRRRLALKAAGGDRRGSGRSSATTPRA